MTAKASARPRAKRQTDHALAHDDIRFRIHQVVLLALCACGTTSQTVSDGGSDATDAAGDAVADVKGPCIDEYDAGLCCCFENLVSCDSLFRSFDASFQLCGDSGADAGCVADTDCSQVGALAQACETADTNDPYAVNAHFICQLIAQNEAGVVDVTCERVNLCGRRFEGLVDHFDVAPTIAGAFAEMAWLEAASVHAFRRLARDLEMHGAPRRLVTAARRAAREESKHARIMERAARRRGGRIPSVKRQPWRARPLAAIARENAIEGCARETYGALVAMWQRDRASDEDARDAFAAIAPDELGHAVLAWEIAAWLEPRLDARTRAAVARAREQALEALALASEPPKDFVARLGMPDGLNARALARSLIAALRNETPVPRSR